VAAVVVVAVVIAVIVLVNRSDSTKSDVATASDRTESAASSDPSNSSTPGESQDLDIVSGFSAWTDAGGVRHTSAGATVRNAKADLAAYDVDVVFKLVDLGGNDLDTQTLRIPYIGPKDRVLAAPATIGFNGDGRSFDLQVSATGRFREDIGPAGDGGTNLDVVNPAIQRDDVSSSVVGQVHNPTTHVVKFPQVTCVLQAGRAIVGGTSTSITEPISPDATVPFSAGLNSIPEEAKTAECTAVD
jgi:hypothetical protein